MNTARKWIRILFLTVAGSLLFTVFPANTIKSYAAEKKVRYLAHRGLSANAPENTLAAFRLAAAKKGFYGVEFDIWESLAEQNPPLLLVMHDKNTKRMCGISADIQSLTRASLQNYMINSGNNLQKYAGQMIPTAEQALDTIWKYSKGAIPVIELKNRLSSKGLKYLIKLIGGHKAVIISFDFNAVSDASKLIRKKKRSGNIKTMYLMKELPRNKYKSMTRKLKKAKIDGISLKYPAIFKKTVKAFHKAGIEVSAWTIPDKKTARKYRRMGVDYITCNSALY